MADDKNVKLDYIGSRFKLVDPNNFEHQNATGLFGDPNYNLSVPLEDLSILVELRTQTKNRTLLNTKQNQNTLINRTNSDINISFIDGKKDLTTGDENYLTTSYTNISAELKNVDEAFGITNIEIDFNSSYAPMVNINFVDIKGAALFQLGATSKYNVLFRLPYPIFELTIKGYYGKPVKYCLHMLKCNTKFNSSNGNFEIAAQFVGYTYAMLSDMLIGYIKAAGLTEVGQELLKKRGIISIKDYMVKVADINNKVPDEVLTPSDESVSNLSALEDIKKDLDDMKTLISSVINSINLGTYEEFEVPNSNENGVTLRETIAIVKDPKPESNTFDDVDNITIQNNYNTQILEKIKSYNTKISGIEDLTLSNSDNDMKCISTTARYVEDINQKSEDLINKIKANYLVENEIEVNTIVERFKTAATNAKEEKNYMKFYDVTNALLVVNSIEQKLKIKQEELTKIVGEKLKQYVTDNLGFDTSIRSIVNLFTTHIEIFLEQLYDVSSKYDSDTARAEELKIFKDPDKSKQIDVYNRDISNNVIYPWPEYHENNVEKYLGSKSGPLKNPLNVPEIKFVEELYEAMKKQKTAEDELGKLENKTKQIWLSTNPVDSYYFNQDQTNPYQRLGDTATHDDFARLAVLRAVAYMGFSNKFLGEEEIKTFAQQDAALIVSKLKDDPNNKIIKALNLNYDSPYKFINVKGVITDGYGTLDSLVLKTGTTANAYRYRYILPISGQTTSRVILPISKDFSNANYAGSNEFTHGFTLSNVVRDIDFTSQNKYDKIRYISIITKEQYEIGNINIPVTLENRTFSLEALNKEFTEFADLDAAGFSSNAGRYGVQDFLKIDYPVIKDAPFFTVFYDDGNKNVKDSSGISIFASASLARPRAETETTVFDLKSTIELPTTTTNYQPDIANAASTNIIGYSRINKIYSNRKNSCENTLLISDYFTNPTNVSFPFFNFTTNIVNIGLVNINLFGSRLYNAQTLEGKAFLFLHCFPWRGLASSEPQGIITIATPAEERGPFSLDIIKNIFKNRTGFIQVPKYFPAFLGGLLKRNKTEFLKFTIKNGNNTEQLIPGFDNGIFGNNTPPKYCYLTDELAPGAAPMSFNNASGGRYIEIVELLTYLPYEAKQTLIKEFDDFVKEYDTIRKDFEILPLGSAVEGDDASWKKAWDNIQTNVTYDSKSYKGTISLSDIENNLKLKNEKTFSETYNVFSFTPNVGQLDASYSEKLKYNYYIEYKDGSAPETKLKEIVTSYKYFSNESIYIWKGRILGVDANGNGILKEYDDVIISEDLLKLYFSEFKTLVNNTVTEMQENKKFLTTDQDEIKLEIYRNLKKTYDKWIAFSDTKEKILFQCCYNNSRESERLSTDKNIQKHRNASQLELIDSFRFVDSFFKDIGDEFNINPFMINEMLLDTTNTSFYAFLSRILTDNNFDFVALPSFVDYNDDKEVLNIFKPYPYYEAVNIVAPSGPSFVCVYVGQTSTKLDFSDDEASQYPNDGFDLSKECTNCPEGVKAQGTTDINDAAAAFVVRYGQQNQNFFKDISLDQAEFGATAESLEITDAISNLGSDTNKAYYGQNLYDVYSVRSYKVEVEMMGDAMIQPMMYFQLQNMPMFHGAYLITHVKHSIKPNNMSTVFTGTRIKSTQTPLIDAASLYGALLGAFALPEGSGVLTNRVSGSFPPIVATIIGNGGVNGNIIAGNITMKKVPKIDGVDNSKSTAPDSRDSMLTEATNALEVMLKDFVSFAKTNNYPTINKKGSTYIGIMSLFRDVNYQKKLYEDSAKDGSVATPGTSNHGWGIAVDLQFINDNGEYINNSTKNASVGFDTNQNKSLKWFLDYGYKYGFIIPYSLRDGRGVEEFWHFEYHGTSAKCLFQKNPDVRGYKPTINENYNAIVINPLTSEKKPAVYDSGCEFVTLTYGDGSDSISTITEGQIADNQVEVKKLLKANGYTKIGAAGAMGNIQIESGFDPLVKPYFDENDQYSWGLVQWNGAKFKDYAIIGKTVASQMDYLFNGWPKDRPIAKKYKELNDSNQLGTAYNAAFLFAKYIEGCVDCSNLDRYNMPNTRYTPYRRSLAANDFLKRFDNPNDRLYWEGDGTQTVTTSSGGAVSTVPISIVIGDSQTPYIAKQSAKAKLISTTGSESALWQGGIGLSALKTFVDKFPKNTTVKNVVISIGTNGKFNINDDVNGLVTSLRTKFPNANLFAVKGSWGWGYNIFTSELIATSTVTSYYNKFAALNVKVIEPAIGNTKDPHNNLPIYVTIGKSIDLALK